MLIRNIIQYGSFELVTQTGDHLAFWIVPLVAQRADGTPYDVTVARMQALGITAVDVNHQLMTLNLDSPGGRAQLGGGEQSIRVLGGARTALALGDTQIALPGAGNRFAPVLRAGETGFASAGIEHALDGCADFAARVPCVPDQPLSNTGPGFP